MKTSIVFFVAVALLLTSSLIHTTEGAHLSNCDSKCARRCVKADEKDKCLKNCGSCCEECKCVPSGNKNECACYKDLKNSKGKPKCP